MRVIVAIDEGTTNCKALAVSETGDVLAVGSRPVALQLPAPGRFEQDATQILGAVHECVYQCLAQLDAPEVLAVAISNQRESVLAFSRRTGEALSPVIGWQDARTAESCAQLATSELNTLVRQRTGLHLDPMYSATKMAWLAQQLGHELTDDVAITTLDAYLVHRLTGGESLLGDATNAARTLLFGLETLAWDEQLATSLGVPMSVLAPVAPSNALFGYTIASGLLPAEVPIHAVLGDSHAALFGQRCEEPGTSKITFGTGSSLLVPTRIFGTASQSAVDTTLGYLTDQPLYAREGNILATGAALETMAAILGVDGGHGLSQLAQQCTSSRNIQVVPAFSGLAAPHWDRNAVGIVTGLERDTTSAEIARATLAAVAHQIADIVDKIEASGDTVTVLRADGGASGNPFMMQIQADLIGKPIDTTDRPEIAALGAARMAAHAIGLGETFDASPTQFTRYEPRLSPSERLQARSQWADAIARSRGIAAPSERKYR